MLGESIGRRPPSRWKIVALYAAGALAVIVLALGITFLPRMQIASSDPVIEEAERMAMPEAPPTPEEQQLDIDLNRLGSTFAGDVGIAVVDLSSDRTVHYNGLRALPQQSVSKLWVAMTALDLVDRGEMELDEKVIIMSGDLTLFHQPIAYLVKERGSFLTDFGDLLDRAITKSDNTANDRLLRRVGGPQAVEAFLERNALGSIRFGSDERSKQSRIAGLTWRQSYALDGSFYDARKRLPAEVRSEAFERYLADPEDGASAVAIAEALARLARGDLLKPQSTRRLLETLGRTRSGPRRLKGGLLPDWQIAHKTGTGQYFDGEQSGYNDVGLLTSPEGDRYAVAVMIGRTRLSNPQRMELMQQVTLAVADYDAAKHGRPLPSAPEEVDEDADGQAGPLSETADGI